MNQGHDSCLPFNSRFSLLWARLAALRPALARASAAARRAFREFESRPAALWTGLGGLCLLLFIGYGVYFHGQAVFDDGCEFGGDVWEYQSIAVNFARGHGFPVFGGVEQFGVYRFGGGQDKQRPEQLKAFYDVAPGGKVYFYRPPG
jgi:hypothetical protein